MNTEPSEPTQKAGPGRREEEGTSRLISVRYLTDEEWEKMKQLSPRERALAIITKSDEAISNE